MKLNSFKLGSIIILSLTLGINLLAASNYTCSGCVDYTWEGSGNYAHSQYTVYYKGAYLSQSPKFSSKGKCQSALDSDSKCSTSPVSPPVKYTCSSSCTYHQSAPGVFPIYFYTVYYGTKVYDKVIFNHYQKGKCMETLDNDVRCKK